MAKVKWSAFFSELPQLVQSAEKINGTSKGSGQTKKQEVLAIVDISAQEATKAVTPVLDPHNATIAQAASAEVDSIVAGFNQNTWPGANCGWSGGRDCGCGCGGGSRETRGCRAGVKNGQGPRRLGGSQ